MVFLAVEYAMYCRCIIASNVGAAWRWQRLRRITIEPAQSRDDAGQQGRPGYSDYQVTLKDKRAAGRALRDVLYGRC